jgi:hypothetical protein
MTTIVGVFKDKVAAESAITEMKNMGVHDTDISFISTKWDSDAAGDGGTKAGEGATAGATTGAIIGAIAGLAVANGVLPGLGTLFVAGPVAAALGLGGVAATTAAGALTGAAAGGILGALTGMGVRDEDAKMYEERVKGGDILVTAKTNDTAAIDAMTKYGAEEVRTY